MQEFATLLDTIAFTGSTLGKRRLMADYFRRIPDPERGYALSVLTGELTFATAKPAFLRDLVTQRVDPVLLQMSRDYVGDMAETVALIWPGHSDNGETAPPLSEVVTILGQGNKALLRERVTHLLDTLDANGRWALLKLITGSLRIGVSARLAKTALADAFHKDVDDIEQIWHTVAPPYNLLFDWLEDKAEKPESGHIARFFPMMLSHAIEESEMNTLDLADYQVELKWDGIRVQIVKQGESVAIYSRTGDDIGASFPDVVQAVADLDEKQFVLDGELLVKQDGELGSFNALQQRLNRKSVTIALLKSTPAHIRLYDILVDNGDDVRPLPLHARRQRLEAWLIRNPSTMIDLSAIIEAPTQAQLTSLRHDARFAPQNAVEGLMIKRRESPYIAGRPRGHWFKWKRNTLTLDCVMLYAQRGSGKRSSYYSDYTFGVWENDKLVPVGKAYSGFTDEELEKLDRWIRSHTTNRFGPVREVKQELVLEIEFDAIAPSNRHKSGLAMRFPRVHRIRWDKPAQEADTLETAQRMSGQ